MIQLFSDDTAQLGKKIKKVIWLQSFLNAGVSVFANLIVFCGLVDEYNGQ